MSITLVTSEQDLTRLTLTNINSLIIFNTHHFSGFFATTTVFSALKKHIFVYHFQITLKITKNLSI